MPGQGATDQPVDIDASASQSAEERLRRLDFELMSVAEMAAAKAMPAMLARLARLSLPVKPLKTRRRAGAIAGRSIDARATMRAALVAALEPLHLSCRRLIWRNPLLRWDGFAPRASGIRAMLPQVDSFRAGHSIDSLSVPGRVISDGRDGGEKARLMQLSGDN